MDSVLVAVKDLFTLNMLIIALSGTILGMVWGAMPALSTTMAMALLVGLTIKMSTMRRSCF
jgi:putative tricarboxylic transport membrane protein